MFYLKYALYFCKCILRIFDPRFITDCTDYTSIDSRFHISGKSTDYFRGCAKHFISCPLQVCIVDSHQITDQTEIDICGWCKRCIHPTDRTDQIIRHLSFVCFKAAHIGRGRLLDLVGLQQIWITVGCKICVTASIEAAHTAISTTLHTHIDPQIIV